MTNIEELLKPVSDAQPCGPDLSNDPQFDELQRLLKGKPEIEVGSVHKPAEPPNWKELQTACERFLVGGKDASGCKHLRVAIIYCCSLLRTAGLPGFRDGLQFVRGLLERYWTTLYPTLDPEDNNDPTARLNILGGLSSPRGSVSGWLTILDYLYAAPLCARKGAPPISFELLQTAKLKQPGAAGTPTDGYSLAQIAEAFRSNGGQVVANHQALKEALEAVQGLDQFLISTLSAAKAMSFEELEKTLKEMLGGLEPYLSGEAVQAGETPQETSGAAGVPGSASINLPASGTIRSRSDVVRALDSICRYYDEVEPASPVPYLLRRAQKLATMNFVQAMKELNLASVDALRPSMGSAIDEKAAEGGS